MDRILVFSPFVVLVLVAASGRAEPIAVGQTVSVEEQSHKTGNAAFPPTPDEAKLRAEIPLGRAAIIGDKGYFLSDGFLYWTRLGSGVSNVVKVHCTFLYDAVSQARDVRFRQITAFREALFLLDDNNTLMVRSARRQDRFVALANARNAVASPRHLFILDTDGRVKVYAGNKGGKSDKRGYEHSTTSHSGFESTSLKDVIRLRLSEGSKVLATLKDGREKNIYDVLEL